MKSLSFTFMLLLLSCSKQEPSAIKDQKFNQFGNKVQKVYCSNYKVSDETLSYENSYNLAKCIKLDTRFQLLFNYFDNVNINDWDYLVAPLNQAFFKGIERRKKFFHRYDYLNDSHNPDKLTNYIKKLFLDYEILEFTDFFAREVIRKKGSERLFDLLLIEELSNDETIDSLREIFTSFEENKTQKFFSQINKETFNSLNKELLNFLSNKLDSSQLSNWRTRLDERKGWVKDFYVLSGNNPQKFIDSITYPSKHYKNFGQDIAILNRYLKSTFQCNKDDIEMRLDIYKELLSKLSLLIKGSKEEFAEELVATYNEMQLFFHTCDNIPSELKVASTRILKNAIDYTREDINYFLLKNITSLTFIPSSGSISTFEFFSSDFFQSLLEIVAERSPEQLTSLFNLLADVSNTSFVNLDNFILNLTEHKETVSLFAEILQEENVIELFSGIVLNHLSDGEAQGIIGEFFLNFFKTDDLLKIIHSHYFQNRDSTIKTLDAYLRLIQFRESKEIKEEFSNYFTKDSLLSILSFVISGGKQYTFNLNIPQTLSRDLDFEVENKKLLQCLNEVNMTPENFDQLLNEFPEACRQLNSTNAFTNLVEWKRDIKSKLKSFELRNNLYTDGSVINNDLEHSLLKLFKAIEQSGSTASNFYKSVKTVLSNKDFHKTVQEVAPLLEWAVEKRHTNNILKEVIKNDSNKNTGFFYSSMATAIQKKLVYPSYSNLLCKDEMFQFIRYESCYSSEHIKEYYPSLLNLLTRKFENENLLTNIIKLIHPKETLRYKEQSYSFDFRDAVTLLFDLTKEKYSKEITYYLEDGSKTTHKLNILAQLEFLISEIGFVDNYYGAFFKNEVSKASNYRKKVKFLKTYMHGFLVGRGLMQIINYIPKNSKKRLRNVMRTYDSLLYADNVYPEHNPETSHAKTLQGIIAASVASSATDSQKYGPLSKPKLEVSNKHNGLFITKFAELSFLRHLSLALKRSSENSIENIVTNHEFKVVNSNFIGSIESSYLIEKLSYIFESNQDQLLEIMYDTTDWYSSLSTKNKELFKSFTWKMVYMASYEKEFVSSDYFLNLLESIVANWSIIKKSFPTEIELIDLIKKLYKYLDSLSNSKSNAPFEIPKLIRALLEPSGVNLMGAILEDQRNEELINSLFTFTNKFLMLADEQKKSLSHIFQVLGKALSSHPELDFRLRHYLIVQSNDDFHDLNIILGNLLNNSSGQTLLQSFTDEVFVNQSDQVLSFLEEITSLVSLQPQ